MNEEEADPSTNIRGEWICARVRYRFKEEEQSDALVFSFATTCRHFPRAKLSVTFVISIVIVLIAVVAVATTLGASFELIDLPMGVEADEFEWHFVLE